MTFADGTSIYSQWFSLLRETTEFPAPLGSIHQSIQGATWYWMGEYFPSVSYYSTLIGVIQLSLLGFCCLKATQAKDHQDENSILNAALVMTVIISPLAWKHNYLLLLPGFAQLLRQRKLMSATASFAFMSILPTILSFFHRPLLTEATPLSLEL